MSSIVQVFNENCDVLNGWFIEHVGSADRFWAYWRGLTGEDDYAGWLEPYNNYASFYPLSPTTGAGAVVKSDDGFLYAANTEVVGSDNYLILGKVSLDDKALYAQSRIFKSSNTINLENNHCITETSSYLFINFTCGIQAVTEEIPHIAIIDKSTMGIISVGRYTFTGQYSPRPQRISIAEYHGQLFYSAQIPTGLSTTVYWVGTCSIVDGVLVIDNGSRWNCDGKAVMFSNFNYSTLPIKSEYRTNYGIAGNIGNGANKGWVEFDEYQVSGFTKQGSDFYPRISTNILLGGASSIANLSNGRKSSMTAYPAVWVDSLNGFSGDTDDYDLECYPTTAGLYHPLIRSEDEFTFYILPASFSTTHYDATQIDTFENMPTMNWYDETVGSLGDTTAFSLGDVISIPAVQRTTIPDLAIQTLGHEYQGDNVYTLDYNLYCLHTDETVTVYFEYGRGALTSTTGSDTGLNYATTGDLDTENTPSGYTYYYRAVAEDSAGRKAYGGIRTILGNIFNLPSATLSRVGSIKHVYDRTTAGIPPKFYMEVNLGGLAPEYMDAFTDQPITYVINRPPAGGAINGGRPDPVYPPDDSYNDYPPDYDPPWPDTSRPRNGGR
jgi:hypothetical protein